MENFADYILKEEDLAAKFEIAYYLSKKKRILFDKSVILKTEIARMFLNYSKIELDKNFLLTACILCNCKKIDSAQDLESMRTYAKKGAEYLELLGFEKKFCKVCEEVNRYSNSNPRERESDILELVDQFGGMLLDRSERMGFKPDEAIVLLEYRNLKNYYNRYLETFKDFIKFMEEISISDLVSMTVLKRLMKIYNESESITKFMKNVIDDYQPRVDKLMAKHMEDVTKEMFKKVEDPNRPLFSQETARKIMNHMGEVTSQEVKE